MQTYQLLYDRMDKDVRDALWQWIIDHSYVDKTTGAYSISFFIKSENDMWKRVYYRYTGQYERYNKEEKQLKKEYFSNKMHDKINDDFAIRFHKMEEAKTVYTRIVIALYRWARDIIKQYEK